MLYVGPKMSNIYFDHALCCQQGNDRTHLHNSIRDVLASVAVQGFGSSNVKVEVVRPWQQENTAQVTSESHDGTLTRMICLT